MKISSMGMIISSIECDNMRERQAICDYLMGWIFERHLNCQIDLKVECGEREWHEMRLSLWDQEKSISTSG